MLILRPKIDAYSTFTINLGPLYVERVFDSLLTREGVAGVVNMSATHRYEKYISYLKNALRESKTCKYAVIQFYLGHFYQQLSQHIELPCQNNHLQEKALCHYQTFLDLPSGVNESRFYAQWQVGMLLDALKYPWIEAEAALNSANYIDPKRGEGYSKLVNHYVSARNWEKAYSYSLISVARYFEHSPIATRRWHVDFNAYNWTVLNVHLNICYKLGYREEARQTYVKMIRHIMTNHHEFTDLEIRHLHSLEKLFPSLNRQPQLA